MKNKSFLFFALAVLMISCNLGYGALAVDTVPTANGTPSPKPVPTETPYTYNTVGSWWLREEPDRKSKALATITIELVQVKRTVGSWHFVEVTIDGKELEGWVHINGEGKPKSPVDE